MVFVNPDAGPWPPRPGDEPAAPLPADSLGGKQETKAKESSGAEHGGGGSMWLVPVTFGGIALLFAVVFGGAYLWSHIHDAPAEARHLAFQQTVTQSSTGLQNHTTVWLCNDFDTAEPNDPSISPQCQHLAPSSYVERIKFAFYNDSTNTYKEVTVCGALIAENDNGPHDLPDIARDNCEEFFNVGPGWVHKTVVVSGTLPWSGHVQILDYSGFYTVNWHQVVGINRRGDTPASRYCASAGAIEPCGA